MEKVTALRLLECEAGLAKLMRATFKPSIGLKIHRMVKQLELELTLVKEKRMEIFKKFGEEIEGGNLAIPKEKVEAANAELEDLLNTELEIEVQKHPLSMIDHVELTPREVDPMVGFLFTE